MAIAEQEVLGMVPADHYKSATGLAVMGAGDVESVRLQASVIAASDLISGRGLSAEQAQATAAIKLFAAYELGLPAVTTATTRLYIIEGRLSMAAELMRALALRSRLVRFTIDESTRERCTISFQRFDKPAPGGTVIMEWKETWDTERATASGMKGVNWSRFPKEMLFARATASGLRACAPDVIGGLYAVEEFGYREADAANAPMLNQDAPLGKAWAEAFIDEMRKIPNPAAVLKDLEAEKAKRYGSAAYKLQAVPRGDEQFWQDWLDERRAASGERVGQQQADAIWARVPKIAAKAGVPEGEVVEHIKQQVADWRLPGLADCNAAQMEEIAGYLLGLTEAPQADDVTEGDFTPAAEPDYDDDPFPETKIGDATGSTTRLRTA